MIWKIYIDRLQRSIETTDWASAVPNYQVAKWHKHSSTGCHNIVELHGQSLASGFLNLYSRYHNMEPNEFCRDWRVVQRILCLCWWTVWLIPGPTRAWMRLRYSSGVPTQIRQSTIWYWARDRRAGHGRSVTSTK